MRGRLRSVRWGWWACLGAALMGCGGDGDSVAAAPEGAGFVRLEPSASAGPAAEGPAASAPAPSEPRSGDAAREPSAASPRAAPTDSVASVSASGRDGSARSPSPGAASTPHGARALDELGAPRVSAQLEQQAAEKLREGQFALAARIYGDLLLGGVRSEPAADRELLRNWAAQLARSQAGHRWSRRGAWPSIEVTVEPGDSLIAIRLRTLKSHPGLLLSTGLIARANELPNEEAIRPGDVLRIPTDRPRAVVDISAMWTLYLLGDEVAAAWEVGVGKDETPTRPGRYTIGLKQKDPMWAPLGRPPVPFGDPENPLGARWLAWHLDGVNSSLGFHGTNDESGIGRRVSDGCVRMRNRDVELLYEILPKDAAVEVAP